VRRVGILADRNTRVLIQGITSKYGLSQIKMMIKYGTKIVAGVSPGKGGQNVLGIPVYDTVEEAVREQSPEASIVYVGPSFAKDAAFEAIDAGIKLLVIPTEGIPVHDTMKIRYLAEERKAWVVGPNSLGLITPGETLLGSLAPAYARSGDVGLLSRSGTLSIEVTRILAEAGLGQSTCVSIGGDSVLGKNPVDYLKEFEADQQTKTVVMLGEIGGGKEYEAAEYIRVMKKPVVAFIAGRTAVPGKRMGHAGALIAKASDSAESKRQALFQAGARIADTPWEIPELVKKLKGGDSGI